MKKAIVIVAVLLMAVSSAYSQERAQADVQVRSVAVSEAGGRLTCRVEVFSVNDDDAHDTTLRILFPVGVTFVSSPSGCTANPSIASDHTQAFATCEIGVLRHNGGRGESRTVEVVTTVPRRELRISKTFGAFAWSRTPDPRPRNNYNEGTAITVTSPGVEVGEIRSEITGYAPAGCLRKGSTVTIRGSGFGDSQGTRRAVLGGNGISVVLPISAWSNTSITATIPNDSLIRVGLRYYIGIQNSEGNWMSNINRSFSICK
ncbi:MAG TPA: IPT/TIG domain-containing protein [Pyrinomonadaceae bacterium]|jgi:hypothetical protein